MWRRAGGVTLDPMNVRTVYDPAPDRVITCAVGSRLVIRLGPLGLVSRWRVDTHPSNLIPLVAEGYQLEFLVFEGECGELELTRYRGNGQVSATLRVYVDPVSARLDAMA